MGPLVLGSLPSESPENPKMSKEGIKIKEIAPSEINNFKESTNKEEKIAESSVVTLIANPSLITQMTTILTQLLVSTNPTLTN